MFRRSKQDQGIIDAQAQLIRDLEAKLHETNVERHRLTERAAQQTAFLKAAQTQLTQHWQLNQALAGALEVLARSTVGTWKPRSRERLARNLLRSGGNRQAVAHAITAVLATEITTQEDKS